MPMHGATEANDSALRGRVQRLVGGMLAATHAAPAVGDSSAWWNELVNQVIWWQCAEKVAGGKALVQSDRPAEISAMLIKCGAVDRAALLDEPQRNESTLVDLLGRYGMSEQDAREVFAALHGLAKRLHESDGGSLQRTLRRHADAMARALAADLGSGVPDNGLLARALEAWIAAMTRLPIAVWSPSTLDFVRKFAGHGVDEALLERVADDAGVDFLSVDQALSRFSEDLCLGCDPREPGHRRCVRHFQAIGWDVACIDPDNRAPAQ